MSLSNVRSYLRARLDGLGFREHDDGFPTDNIPETVIDRSYHILVNSIDGGPINHTHQDTFSNVEIRVFFRGFRNVTEAIDSSISGVETIIRDVCKVANRTSTVLNCVFENCTFEPMNSSNDNSVLVTISFNVQVVLGVEEI